jgi:hypothetical protein
MTDIKNDFHFEQSKIFFSWLGATHYSELFVSCDTIIEIMDL